MDMLNGGHVVDVHGVLLLRPTASPTLCLQDEMAKNFHDEPLKSKEYVKGIVA